MKIKKRKTVQMFTRWGKILHDDKDAIPLADYPRMQLRRTQWQCLNGWWEYAIVPTGEECSVFEGKIRVPFSPEAALSEVNRTLLPHESLIYQRDVFFEDEKPNSSVLLHFGAVDQRCEVFFDQKKVGSHTHGYLPFTINLGMIEKGLHTIRVIVRDDSDTSFHSRGKQSLHPHGIWYSAQSGIWQTVWFETVPESHIQTLYTESDILTGTFIITVRGTGNERGIIRIFADDEVAGEASFNGSSRVTVPVRSIRLWSCEEPFLYDIEITYGDDTVYSYAAMRTISIGFDNHTVSRLLLNNKPYVHKGILDQGYWPDGLYTAPSDEALLFDIKTMKSMGFNMLRKHIKIEPDRWYYHCDRLGMLVWQDMVSGGSSYNPLLIAANAFLKLPVDDQKHRRITYRTSLEGRLEFEHEIKKTIRHLKGHPSIVVWVLFNEGWGQFDSLRLAKEVRELDATRIIDHASGWYDQNGPDLRSLHIYFRKIRMPKDHRPIVLSEFGGYSLPVEDHVYNVEKSFGYKKLRTEEQLNTELKKLYEHQIIPYIPKGLCATVYTQLSDVEDEINGLVTYDRAIVKVNPDLIVQVHDKMILG
ncbi:MAG: glycoside hydrolase family 2 TIM barrel-domain containing protein [Sphaerochaetaceae bacterium]|nr:glycoside hydrolase family 2 TIM barrel-domain containing protein [Sphaerochaetaceae bacterium]